MNTGVIQAAFFDANVVAPLAIVMGVSAMNFPSADARVTCLQIGISVDCR